MKWAAVAMVHRRIWVRAGGQQQSNDLDAIAGRSQMQGRVANVQPVKDFLIVVSGLADSSGDKRRIGSQQILDRRGLVIKDGSKEGVHSYSEGLINTAIRAPVE